MGAIGSAGEFVFGSANSDGLTDSYDESFADNPNPMYGAGQTIGDRENPDWAAWNANAWAAREQYGEGSPEHQAALQNEPPKRIQTQLAHDVGVVNETGDTARRDIKQDAREIERAGDQAFSQGQQVSAGFGADADKAARRNAPQLDVPTDSRNAQKDALAEADAFKANDSGAAGIRQAGNQAIQGISTAGNQGVQGISTAGNQAVQGVGLAGAQGAQSVGSFRADKSGISALNKFAQGPAGPSAAAAQLRMQADRDKRTALALARSARGGPGAVAQALRRAQGENAATAAETRGQAGVLRAQEEAAARGQNLSALTAAGSLGQQASGTNLAALQGGANLGLQGQIAAGQLGVTAQTNAAQVGLDAQQSAGALGVQATTAATQAELTGSAQNLQGTALQGQLSSEMRGQDIETAKANLGAELQTLNLNDEQVRFFTTIGEQARQAGITARADALSKGLDADKAAEAVTMAYMQQAYNMLSNDQQVQLQREATDRGLAAGVQASDAASNQAGLAFLGTLFSAASDRRVKRAVTRLRGVAHDLRKKPSTPEALARTRTFRGAVKNVGGKKVVDSTRLAMSQQSAFHDLQKQVDRLSSVVKRKKSGDSRPDTRN